MSELININAELRGYIHKGVSAVGIDDGGYLNFEFTDGTVKTLGKVVGEQGEKGEKGDKGDKGESAVQIYTLIWHEEPTQLQLSEMASVFAKFVGHPLEKISLYLEKDGRYLTCLSMTTEDEAYSTSKYKVCFTDGDMLYYIDYNISSDEILISKKTVTYIDSEVLI